jgi:hypothetical protein
MFAYIKRIFTSPGAVALLVLAIAIPAFALLKAATKPDYSLTHAQVTRAALADERVSEPLGRYGYTSIRVSPLDKQQQRVSFLDGDELVLHAAVGPTPKVTSVMVRTPGAAQSGSEIANFPPMLLLLSALFVLATATVPLRRWRNLDSLALASFTLPVWLLNQGLVELSVIVSSPPLIYLAARLMLVGLGRAAREPGTSLYWHLTRGWPRAQRLRVLKLVVAATTLAVSMVVLTSTGASDVAFAALAGATKILDGVAPYGHIPDFIVHGDTYPLLTYVAYLPGAAIEPVYDFFSEPTGALLVAMAATLFAAWGLYRMTVRTARAAVNGGTSGLEPPTACGLRMVLAWMALPPVILTASAGSNDPLLAACLVAALLAFGRERATAFLLGVAAWVKVIPVLALPIWLARLGRRSLLQVVAALAALSGAMVAAVVALDGTDAVSTMVHAIAFQFERASLSSLWTGLGLGPLQPVAQAAMLACIAAAVVAVRRERSLRDDLPRMAALLGGIMLAAQIAANYWTWAYLPWALAPMLLSLFAPVPARRARPRAGADELAEWSPAVPAARTGVH